MHGVALLFSFPGGSVVAGAGGQQIAGDAFFQACLPAPEGAALVDMRRVLLPEQLKGGSVGVRAFAFLARTE